MGMSSGNRGGALSEINVTPLVDVMLVLLIVFMVTTPIIVDDMVQRKIEIDLPTTNAQPVAKSDLKTLLVLHPDYKVGLDLGEGETDIAECGAANGAFAECLGKMAGQVENNERLKDGRRVFLMADRALPYGFVVDVMARLKKAGIGNLGMVTNPPAAAGDPG